MNTPIGMIVNGCGGLCFAAMLLYLGFWFWPSWPIKSPVVMWLARIVGVVSLVANVSLIIIALFRLSSGT